MNVSKISDITPQDLADFIRLSDPVESDLQTLGTLLGVAKTYIEQYTGRNLIELDTLNDVVIVAFILVQDMWDNRTMYVDNTNVNRTVESILNLHVVNLL